MTPLERIAVLANAPRLLAMERWWGKRNLAPIVTFHDLELRVRELELFVAALEAMPHARAQRTALTP